MVQGEITESVGNLSCHCSLQVFFIPIGLFNGVVRSGRIGREEGERGVKEGGRGEEEGGREGRGKEGEERGGGGRGMS